MLGTAQFAEFALAVVRQSPRSVDPATAQGWIQDRRALADIRAVVFFLVLAMLATIVQAGTPVQQLTENSYKVVVNHGQPLKEMIAASKYDYVNSDITAGNFPIQLQGSGQQHIVIELVHFGQDMESETVLKDFEARGLRAATFSELLAFGSTYPEKQLEFPIIALGSMTLVHDDRYVPYLDSWLAKRGLNLNWFIDIWHDDCRFAAVRK